MSWPIWLGVPWFGFSGLGCTAESLQIPLPKRGVASIHQEDLKRGIWALEQGKDAQQWWQEKSETLSLKKYGNDCIATHPPNAETITVWASPTLDRTSVISLFSLAKSTEFVPLSQEFQFCVAAGIHPSWGHPLEIQNFTNGPVTCSDVKCGASEEKHQSFTEIHFVTWVENLQQVARFLKVPEDRSSVQ